MQQKEKEFLTELWTYYTVHARQLPWRIAEADGSYDAYKILVSEMMLQQTQVKRVLPKFEQFILKFPTMQSLAAAPLRDVLISWEGLGYTRRAKFLHETSKYLSEVSFPQTIDQLVACKGIGYNTAAAILTYAFNQRHVYIETNVRTVYFYHFFVDNDLVSDAELKEIIEKTLDYDNPREFMWAVMDYGSHLKSSGFSNIKKSKQYARQSTFKGSIRQMRGDILRAAKHSPNIGSLHFKNDPRFEVALADLRTEGLITVSDNHLCLAG